MPISRLRRRSTVSLPLALAALLAWLPLPAGALELNGSTVFARAPWKAELISYDTTVGSGNVTYYLTINLDPGAGASLGQLTVQQIRGVDWSFPFWPEQTRAFLGRPRQQGPTVPVRAAFDARQRLITVEFPQPVQAGQTLTVALRPRTNPQAADTYQFQVAVWPAGPNPVASPVGTVTLRIYERYLY